MELKNHIQTYFLTYHYITNQEFLDSKNLADFENITNQINISNNRNFINDNKLDEISGIYVSTYQNNLLFKPVNNFKYIKSYPQITTPDYKKIYYNYLRKIILEKICKNNLNLVYEIFEDNGIEPDLPNGDFSYKLVINNIVY